MIASRFHSLPPTDSLAVAPSVRLMALTSSALGPNVAVYEFNGAEHSVKIPKGDSTVAAEWIRNGERENLSGLEMYQSMYLDRDRELLIMGNVIEDRRGSCELWK